MVEKETANHTPHEQLEYYTPFGFTCIAGSSLITPCLVISVVVPPLLELRPHHLSRGKRENFVKKTCLDRITASLDRYSFYRGPSPPFIWTLQSLFLLKTSEE